MRTRWSKEKRRGGPRRCPGPSHARAPGFAESETVLWEEDLDTPVLLLAHTGRCRHARIVHAATGDGHIAARDTKSSQSSRHSVRPPLGKPLIVAGRARQIGVPSDLQSYRATRMVLLRGELEDLVALRRDVVLIPVEEDEVDLLRRRRWCCRRQRRRRRRRRHAELHRYAGYDVVRPVFGGKAAACAAVDTFVTVRERVPCRAVVGDRRAGGPQVTIVEVKRDYRAEIVAKARDPLVAEIPGAAVQEGAAECLGPLHGERGRRRDWRAYGIGQGEGVDRQVVDDFHRTDAGSDMGSDRPA